MSVCNGCGSGAGNFNNLVNYAGGWNSIPQFLHNLMQGEAAQHRDWFNTMGTPTWVPNWNSPQFHRWIRKLTQQMRNYIDTAKHTVGGVVYNFKDALRIYDIGYYGNYSEQHSAALVNNISEYPAGSGPTTAGLSEIVDAQTDAWTGYTNLKFVVPFNAFDCDWLAHTRNPIQYGRYLLDHPDSIGWINDHIGSNESYDHDYLELNNRMGGNYNNKLMNRWKFSPTGGEPVGWGSPADRSAIPAYVNTYHMSFFGNGNLDHITNSFTTEANNIRTASRQAGYRLRLTGGSAVVAGNLTINLNWLNEGNAPPYHNWTVRYLIKNGAGTIVSTLTSNFNPRYFQPSGSPTTRTQAFAIPAVPAGTYGLYVKVVDPTNYTRPMRLAITPAQSDTSYFLANINLSGGTNQNPVANAGPNQSITASSTTLTSTGSSDADGTIASFLWTRVSGPNTPTIVTPTGATTSVTGLIAGTYVFNLTVTDDDGATGSDQVQITVNPNSPPVSNAGVNQTITLPTSSVTVNGSGSTDNIAISSYLWSKVSGPISNTITNPTSVSTTITGLTAGVYVFRLTVTDGSGLTDTDDMQVTVNAGNSAPVSNAGTNQTITLPTSSVTLNGGSSSDDVGITEYLWTKVGGPATFTITSPTSVSTSVTGLVAGIYIFRLRVEDVAGLFTTDDVQITVNAAPNGTPVANAGANQAITLPTNSVTVSSSGSTDDVAIVSRTWTKTSGPATFTIVSPTSISTAINNLVAGVYTFRITVFDGGGLSSFDEVQITVNAIANAAPNASAGANQSITLPTSSTSVDGSASTDDVAITAYLWTKVSGPAGGTISTPTTVSTNISSLQQGIYVFRLRVQDAQGLFDTDDMQITVDPVANNAPVAVAGSPQTIQLPTDFVTLDGSGSTDDVAVTAYAWTKISGPASFTIVSPTSSSTSVTGLTAGIYFFQLTVTDGSGFTDTDEVTITVLAAPTPPRPSHAGHSLFRSKHKFLPRN